MDVVTLMPPVLLEFFPRDTSLEAKRYSRAFPAVGSAPSVSRIGLLCALMLLGSGVQPLRDRLKDKVALVVSAGSKTSTSRTVRTLRFAHPTC